TQNGCASVATTTPPCSVPSSTVSSTRVVVLWLVCRSVTVRGPSVPVRGSNAHTSSPTVMVSMGAYVPSASSTSVPGTKLLPRHGRAGGRVVSSSLRRLSPGWSPSARTGPGVVSEPRSLPPMTLRARLPFLYQPTPGIRPMRFSAMPWATACVLSPFFQSSWTSSLTSRSRKNPPGSVVTWFQVFLAPSTMLSLASENHCPGSFHSFLAPSHRPTASSLIPVTKSAPASQMPVPTSFSPWPIVSKSPPPVFWSAAVGPLPPPPVGTMVPSSEPVPSAGAFSGGESGV